MLTTKLTTTHDRLSLKIAQGKTDLRLTMSRSKVTITASLDFGESAVRAVSNMINKFLDDKKDTRNYGKKFEVIELYALSCADFKSFVDVQAFDRFARSHRKPDAVKATVARMAKEVVAKTSKKPVVVNTGKDTFAVKLPKKDVIGRDVGAKYVYDAGMTDAQKKAYRAKMRRAK